jgi:hypothetical protein
MMMHNPNATHGTHAMEAMTIATEAASALKDLGRSLSLTKYDVCFPKHF